MKTKTPKPDNRPRFGWCGSLDSDPQRIWEEKIPEQRAVALIPLPFNSPKIKKAIREFTKSLWPKP